ncbi:MAG: gluconokinase, partial [Burkholderiales bacterium]
MGDRQTVGNVACAAARGPSSLCAPVSKPSSPFCVVVMGVSGCGKTTLGQALAVKLGIDFFDADDFHPQENVEKMRAATPLTDSDRAPWLHILNDNLKVRTKAGQSLVLACSALKQRYRDALAADIPTVHWVFLEGSYELIAARIRARSATTGHYMPADLLRSQFEALELPMSAVSIAIGLPTE